MIESENRKNDNQHAAYNILLAASQQVHASPTTLHHPSPSRVVDTDAAPDVHALLPDASGSTFRLFAGLIFICGCLWFFISVYRMSGAGEASRSEPIPMRPVLGAPVTVTSGSDESEPPPAEARPSPTPLPDAADPRFDRSVEGPGPSES